tara:strand:- start:1222 stop:1425 length:204 start_codon:yes stop_codon:yes gene_type:complete
MRRAILGSDFRSEEVGIDPSTFIVSNVNMKNTTFTSTTLNPSFFVRIVAVQWLYRACATWLPKDATR